MRFLGLAVCGILVLLSFPKSGNGQQYIPFAQHVFNASSVNPAYSGYKEDWYGQVGLRSQWTSVKGAPRSGYLSVDGILDREYKRHGAGVVLSYDKIGVQSASSFFVNYALRLQVDAEDSQRLSLGFSGGWTQYSLNGRELTYIDEEDPYVPQGIITTWRPDIRLGAFYYSPSWYVGIAVHDLFSDADSREDFVFNQNSLEGLYRNTHAYFMVGAALPMYAGWVFRPSLLIKDDLETPTSLDVNVMAIFDEKFWVGMAYRTRTKLFGRNYSEETLSKFSTFRSIALLSQFHTPSKLRIGYSFEYNLNRIAGMNGGTHELSIGVPFGHTKATPFTKPKYF